MKISSPPVAPILPVIDTLYGRKIVDPYRYMENLKDTAVQRWFRQQNAYTRSVLGRIPGRDRLLADIKKYDNSVPAMVENIARVPDDIYFYEKTLPGQQVAKLYMQHGLSGKEQLLFDPGKYEKKGGSQWAISYYVPSFDGRYVAIGISPGGSENATVHVVDTKTGKETGDVIPLVLGNIAWKQDSRSFFYTRRLDVSQKNRYDNCQVYLHVLGTDPKGDPDVFGNKVTTSPQIKPSDTPLVSVKQNSTYAFGLLEHGTQNAVSLYITPLSSVGKAHKWKKIFGVNDDITDVSIHGNDLYLVTYKNAPHFKIIHINLKHPDMGHAQTVVPQSDRIIHYALPAKDALYVNETDGVVSNLLRVPYDGGQPKEINLPYKGSLPYDGSPQNMWYDPRIPGVLFAMTSWTRAAQIYTYNPQTKEVKNTHLQSPGPYGNAKDLESREVEVESYDGAMVPLSIIYKKGMKLDGSNPVILWGYGAYGSSYYPFYIPFLHALYDRGGILAVAHIRGGGVYGEKWRKAGYKLTKPNTWRDFIACAKYLIKHKYTSSSKLAIRGGSAGGITVGRAMTEQPNLFAAVIDMVGVSNPLRFEFTPNGPSNIPEFGSIKSQAGFEDLYAMDSYQHVRDGVKYPAVLLTTGWNDPRVAPWQAGKMAARLQAATASGKPVLLRVDYNGGHGYGSSKEQQETETATEFSFAFWQMGMPGFQPQE
ncbi:MAG TPA: prolyl oligopeptidase family serine peptidase [Bacteroidales bacterium]|nr:prolyl oligopeptidase family serine peptidase [Bacteroidales bacterium]